MTDRPQPTRSATPPGDLEQALGWLQRNLDVLTAAAGLRSAVPGPSDPEPAPAAEAAPGGRAEAAQASRVTPTRADVEASPVSSDPASVGQVAPTDTPLLHRLGRDLTALAREGKLTPVIGRATELDWLVEVLVRRSKRNPVLLGPAGAGKTAIVEGLAQRIVEERVPELLRGTRIVEVPLASLVAGTEYRGQFEERLAKLVVEASRPDIILFIDEIHLLSGAGRSEGGISADEALKPALSRGEIAVIGATTPEEYRASIEKDQALARRFTAIAISELDRDATRPILRAVGDSLASARGVDVTDAAIDVFLDFAERRIANRRFPDKGIDLLEQAVASAIVAGRTRVTKTDAVRVTEIWEARASSTPTLDRFGRDLVRLAREGGLGPIVGRDAEIDLLIEILMRRTRRNPLLLGPAGSGKTAIVEGLAIRIAAGEVPLALKDVRLFDVALLPLGASVARDSEVLAGLLVEARHPSVAVFFDEIHQLAAPAVEGLAQALKPALARGEIACIGATTGEEFQASLEPDAALVRRFSVVRVSPMDSAAIRRVLGAVRDSLGPNRGVRFEDGVIDELIALGEDFLPNRSFPDKGVDLLEQAVAREVARGQTIVTVATIREVLSVLTGAPLDPGPALEALAEALRDEAPIPPDAATALVSRLSVSLRGLDAGRDRPDAFVLLCGAAAASAVTLERLVARHAMGAESRRIVIDAGTMADESALSTLLGSAPGLVGSDRPLPLADLRREPRQVVAFHGLERAALVVRETVAAGIVEGGLTDAMGRSLPLRSAVVVLTAPSLDLSDAPERLGAELVAACDVAVDRVGDAPAGGDARVRERVLEPFAARMKRRGIELELGDDFVAWFVAQAPTALAAAEAFLDREVAPRLVSSLPDGAVRVRATLRDGEPVLAAVEP